MTLYMLYMISPLIGGFLFAIFGKSAKKDNRYLVFMGVIIFLFFALRNKNVGSTDALFYYNLWEQFGQISFQNIVTIFTYDLESGYLIFCWVLSHLFRDGQFVFVVSGLIYSITICKYLHDNSEDYMLGLLMFNGLAIVGFFMQGIRQSLAICICLWAVKFCKERKLIPFLILLFVAIQFHASALVFIVAYFLYGIRINYKSIVLVGLLSVLVPSILGTITNVANMLMNESYIGGTTDATSGGTVTMIMYVLMVLYMLLLHKKPDGDLSGEIYDTEYSYYFFMFLVGVMFFSTRFFYITVFERASYYFTAFSIPIIDLTKKRFTSQSTRIVSVLLVIFFTILSLYKAGPSSVLYDYHFFWYN